MTIDAIQTSFVTASDADPFRAEAESRLRALEAELRRLRGEEE